MATQMAEAAYSATDPDNYTGYRSFQIGGFGFRRDEYFALRPHGRTAPISCRWMPSCARWCARWRGNFFYGTLNFDDVFGTTNLYGQVELYIGRYNDAYRDNGRDYQETIDSDDLRATFQAMLEDWTNTGYDPFTGAAGDRAALRPQERAQSRGPRPRAGNGKSAWWAFRAMRRSAPTRAAIR